MEYNLKITTDDSELQGTQDLLVEIGDTANELQSEVEGAFNSDPVEIFTEATDDAAEALNREAAAAKKAATEQEKLNKSTAKGTKGNKRLGKSLITNALRLAGFNKEARIAGAGLEVLNKVSLKKIGTGIKNLGSSAKNLLVSGVKNLASGFKNLAVNGARSFKALVVSARGASLGIKGALIGTGIGALVVAVGLLIANFDKLRSKGVISFKSILIAINPFIGIFTLIISKTEDLGETFDRVFQATKKVIEETIALTRDLLSSVTGGLIDSAERAAERAAQVAREANREVLASERDKAAEIVKLNDSLTNLAVKQAQKRGAAQSEVDKIFIDGNKEKARLLDEELKRQNKIIFALEEEVRLQKNASVQDKDSIAAREKAEVELNKARNQSIKIQQQIAQTSIDNANIIEAAAAREEAAIKKANDERAEGIRLEGLRKEEVQRLQDELLRSEEEVQIRRAKLDRDATKKRIEKNVKDNKLKDELILANDEAYLQEKANIEATFAQARLDLENSITLSATDLKIQKINEETQARVEAIQKAFGETEKADKLILQLQKQQADKIQEIQRKAREKERKEEAKRIKETLSIESKKLEIARNTALQSVNIERQRGETEEETAQRIANEKERIELQYQRDILQSRLDFNTQLSDLDRQLIEQQIEALNNQLGDVVDSGIESNPFDFKSKIKAALQDLGLRWS